MRVLICDDNLDSANTWAALLSAEGHEVRVSPDGRRCLDDARDWRAEAALVDIGLPSLDGYAVARALRAQSSGDSLLLIAVTGYGAPEHRRRAREAGFDLHFVKPAGIDEVLQALKAREQKN